MRYPDCAFLVRFTLFECREERRVPDVLLAGSARTTSRDLFGIEPLLEMSSYPKSAQRGQRSFQKSGASVCLFQKANMLRAAKEPHNLEVRVATKFTHEEIAQMIGSSRETVTRLLSDLKRKELIRLEGSTLVISNRIALQAIAS